MTAVRVTRAIVALALAVGAGMIALGAQAPRIEYDEFCKLDLQARNRLFNVISPENRADLVRTQIQRWLEKNRARLTPAQIQVMEDNAAFIKADLYRLPRREADMAKAKELEQRTLALMSREDMTEALTVYGSCIPKT
jgi:hypothetical protein